MTLALILAEAAAEAAPVKGVAAVANNFQVALLAFKAGGWIVALIGAAAMVAIQRRKKSMTGPNTQMTAQNPMFNSQHV